MRKVLSTLSVIIFFNIKTFAFIGAVSTATGGTGRGAVEPVDGILLNPAIISDLPNKALSLNYSTDQWGLVVTDNGKDAYFPAALQFIKTSTNQIDTQKLAISFATPRWYKVAFGATAAMLEYTNFVSPSLESKYRQSTLDLAATLAISRDFGFGFVVNKVASSKVDLVENLQVQRTAAIGASYTYLNFARVRFDVESSADYKTDRLNYMYGLENYINDFIVFRLGYQNNNVINKNYVSLGAGFAGPQFGLHYAYTSNTTDSSDIKHLIDLAVPF